MVNHERRLWRIDILIAAAIVVLAFGLRLLRAGDGLPYMHFWDEPQIAFRSLDMLKSGDLNPHFFNYGSLMMYLNLGIDQLHLLHLRSLPTAAPGYLTDLAELNYGSFTGFDWFISHPSFLFWNRALTGLLGAMTAALVYLMGFKAGGRLAALLGAVLLAVLGFHVEHSAYVTTDVPMVFFVWLAVCFSYLYLEGQQPKWLVLSLAACGLATSVKYNAGLSCLVPLAAFMLSYKKPGYRSWLWLALPLVPVIAFFLGSPFALLDVHKFINDAWYEARHYAEIGHGWAHVQPGLPHMLLQASYLVHYSGRVATAFALVGCMLLAKKRQHWPWLLLLLVYFLVMTQMRVSFHRNFLLFYPAIAIAFGLGAAGVWRWLKGRSPSGGRWLAYVFLIFTAGFLTYKSIRIFQVSWQIWHTAETRSQAVLLAVEMLEDRPTARVAVAQELRLHPNDLAQLPAGHTIAPFLDLLQQADDYELILGIGRVQGSNSRQRQQAAALNRVIDQIPEERLLRIGSAGLYLDIPSTNPQVTIITNTQGLPDRIDWKQP